MPDLSLIGAFIGGLGLFLLGMALMTDGLKIAAGRTLRDILGRWTRTRLRGLLAGALVTSMVQSSSAVTVATIGFVNAGLLTLAQAVWVIFGANVGTSMTGWLVALVGFHVRIDALALPLLGLGMLLRITGADRRRGAIGVVAMEEWLTQMSRVRRVAQQAAKAAQRLQTLRVGGPGAA